METFIKVDRAQNASEIQTLIELGVNCIGLDLRATPLLVDNRHVAKEQAQIIRAQFPKIQMSAHLPDTLTHLTDWTEFLKRCSFDYVEISSWNLPDRSFRRELIDTGIGIIYSQIDVSYDTDPSWILARFEEEEDIGASFFQLELLPDVKRSWHFLKTECPRFPEELQIKDIEDLAGRHPILLSLDFSPDTVLHALKEVKNIRGFGFTLGKMVPGRCDIHTIEFAQLASVLNALKSDGAQR